MKYNFQLITFGIGLGLLACSGSTENVPPSGSAGSTSTSGGVRNTGGVNTTGGVGTTGGVTGGTSPNSGGTATGGAASSGEGASSGLVTGGVTATGGMMNSHSGASAGGSTDRAGNGGTSDGGTAGSSGAKASGGSPSTGGTSGGSKKFVGNITTRDSVDTDGLEFSKYWDQITPENAGKWGSVQPSPGAAFNWATLDAIYGYAQLHGILFKQHTFVWGGQQQPSGTPTLAQVENWIKSFCERYPNTKLIDVVNEPPPHTTPTYAANLGAGESGTYGWITKAFKLARQYCGSAILILNDYNNIEYGDQEDHFIDIVAQVRAAGAPVDAVGVQAHDAHRLTASELESNIKTMTARTGLPIYVTEYDVPHADDQAQLSIVQKQFPIFWNTAAVHGITIWGWINEKTWVPNTGLVNGNKPRPAMTWLMQQLGRPVPPN